MTQRYSLETLEFQTIRDRLTGLLETPLGRTGIEALRPFPDAASANRSLQQVAELAERLAADPRLPLPSLHDIRGWLPGFFKGDYLPSISDLVDLKRLLGATVACRGWLTTGARFQALTELATGFPEVREVAEQLGAVLDETGEIRSTASPKLAEIRKEIEAAELNVRREVQRFLSDERVYKYLQNPEPSWRNGRPVFQVRRESQGQVPGVLHDRSSSGATIFIEPQIVVPAANALAEARSAEHREIQVILAHVCRGLRRYDAEILDAVRAIVELDVTVAKARLLADPEYSVPEVVEDGVLALEDARHPLLLAMMPRDEIQPLSLTLGDRFRVLVVTGPNTGGKTVVLKTIGLLSLMALSGIPIPAQAGARIPVFDGVFVDVGDEQGIAQNLSTFSSHIMRIADCLAEVTNRSLVLLDELGSGTDPEEGGALGYAVLEELEQRQVCCVVSTHLGRLKDFAYQHAGAENGSMAFDRASHRPLYRLELGIPGASHALDIAQRVGLPEAIVSRAREHLGLRDQRMEEAIERVHDARRRAEENRADSEAVRRTTDEAARQAEDRLVELGRKEAWLEEEADQVVEAGLREAREQFELAFKELANAPKPFGERAQALRVLIQELLANTSVHRRRMKFLGALRKNGLVYVPRLNRQCHVKKVDRNREMLVIEVGKIRMEIPFEDVSWLQPLD
jgi:DNA mismatch repair protein MutS2